MDALTSLAGRHGLALIEDACHGHGGVYRGKKLGSIGHAGCFSFQSSKNLNCGEGGMVVTDDDSLADMIRSLRNVGRVKGGQWYEHHYLGCNYRMTQLQVALLGAQFNRLEEQTRTRNANGIYLDSLLDKIPGIRPLERRATTDIHTYHIYIFRYDKEHFGGIPKKEFAAMLAAEGVPCFMGYPEPLYRQPVFQKKNFMCYALPDYVDYSVVCCPVAEKACYDEAVWIMQNAMLGTRTDMEAIASAIMKIQKAAK
jgi:dTDP-4-amino-4,6-dideoxygalactose transaminase